MKHVMPGYEKRKVTIDLYKHFSTLSIGVLALSAAFIGNFAEMSEGKNAVLFAVSCFFAVIITSSISKYILVTNIEEVPHLSVQHKILRFCGLVTFFCFFLGAGCFLYIVAVNV
jgi:hypothetical protein